MAHYSKWEKDAVHGIAAEAGHLYDRDNVDRSRSHLNYCLGRESYDFAHVQQAVDARISEARAANPKMRVQRNSIRLCTWVVTLPPEVREGDERKFFESCYDFFVREQGAAMGLDERNVMYCVVHKDERTPHMHLGWVPITEDNRLAARDYTKSKNALGAYQRELNDYVDDRLGYHVHVLRDAGDWRRDLSGLPQDEYKRVLDGMRQEADALDGAERDRAWEAVHAAEQEASCALEAARAKAGKIADRAEEEAGDAIRDARKDAKRIRAEAEARADEEVADARADAADIRARAREKEEGADRRAASIDVEVARKVDEQVAERSAELDAREAALDEDIDHVNVQIAANADMLADIQRTIASVGSIEDRCASEAAKLGLKPVHAEVAQSKEEADRDRLVAKHKHDEKVIKSLQRLYGAALHLIARLTGRSTDDAGRMVEQEADSMDRDREARERADWDRSSTAGAPPAHAQAAPSQVRSEPQPRSYER